LHSNFELYNGCLKCNKVACVECVADGSVCLQGTTTINDLNYQKMGCADCMILSPCNTSISLIAQWASECTLLSHFRGPGSMPGHGRVFQGIFPRLITHARMHTWRGDGRCQVIISSLKESIQGIQSITASSLRYP